ncbi:unnamed protein product [Cylindrotheca closterium]|uniref:Uncharacterized protein n=1 Tax=Cylindrotheca closterium TaxID=2856 RepID=A0AAD2G687_9STRA|nr:unnamed protein product [Cylindrotheca closterium]
MKFLNLPYILVAMVLASSSSSCTSNGNGVAAFSLPKQAHSSGSITSSTELNLESLEQKTPDNKQTSFLLDTYGEKSRIYRRSVFSAADWIKSRRSNRFIDTLLKTSQSALVRQLGIEILFISAVATAIVTYNNFFIEGWIDFKGIEHEAIHFNLPTLAASPFIVSLPPLELPKEPFTLTSSSLGLLLSFRTNVSYKRWNEARTAWGKVINDSRSIARMGAIWSKSYKDTIDDAALQRLGDAICSFSRALMNRTLPPQEDETNFNIYTYQKVADQNYGQVLRSAKHRPTAALAEISNILVDFQLNPLHQVEVERVVTGLCDALGASERIFTSPVPTFYTRHTARFLAFWLLALPMGLYQPMAGTWNHWGVVPVTMAISGFLLGIEELATQLEEPFSILPMEKMCEGSIRTAVMEQVERSKAGIQSPYYGEM